MNCFFIFTILSCLIPGSLLQYRGYSAYREGTICRTPDFMGGRCKKLPNCPTLYNRFTHPQYLRQSNVNCGHNFIGDSALVCCNENQKPPVDHRALQSAERCINSVSQRGVCIPTFSCESLFSQLSLGVPKIIEKCGEGSALICCPILMRRSIKLLSMEDGCGEAFIKTRTKRIIGGETSKIGNWPWIALLGYSNLNLSKFSCTGTLISERHVLTAAHCLKSTLEFVRLGEHDLSTNEESEHNDIPVSEQVPHPEYNLVDSLYDIGILLLYEKVAFTRFISPICLPLTSDLQRLQYEGTQPFVAGWGRTMEDGSGATIIQNIQIQVYNNSVCKELYENHNALKSDKQFSEAVICAGDLFSGKDSCKGDSGGPLMLPVTYGDGKRFVLIGLVSYGIGCGRKDVLSINTNVKTVISWIKDTVARLQ